MNHYIVFVNYPNYYLLIVVEVITSNIDKAISLIANNDPDITFHVGEVYLN